MQMMSQQQIQHQIQQEKLQQQQRLQSQPQPNLQNAPNPNQGPHPSMMQQTMSDQSAQQQAHANAQAANMPPPVREKIWTGVLEWVEKAKNNSADKIPHQVPCYVTAKEGDPEMYVISSMDLLFNGQFYSIYSYIIYLYRQGDNWPPRLLMQLMPKQLVGNIGQQYLKESRSVAFHLSPVFLAKIFRKHSNLCNCNLFFLILVSQFR